MAQRPLTNRLWYQLFKRSLQLAGILLFRVRYSGLRNIPQQGAVLVVSNHQSHLDPPFVGMGCTRRMNYLGRQSLFSFRPFGWLLHSLDVIPIDREGVSVSAIKQSLKCLKAGEMLLVFPEGTRTPDGQVKRFKPGFTALAQRTRAIILPAAIDGAFDAWPRWHKLPRAGHVRVHYGEPIPPEQYAGLNEHGLLALVEARVRECQLLIKCQSRKRSLSLRERVRVRALSGDAAGALTSCPSPKGRGETVHADLQANSMPRSAR